MWKQITMTRSQNADASFVCPPIRIPSRTQNRFARREKKRRSYWRNNGRPRRKPRWSVESIAFRSTPKSSVGSIVVLRFCLVEKSTMIRTDWCKFWSNRWEKIPIRSECNRRSRCPTVQQPDGANSAELKLKRFLNEKETNKSTSIFLRRPYREKFRWSNTKWFVERRKRFVPIFGKEIFVNWCRWSSRSPGRWRARVLTLLSPFASPFCVLLRLRSQSSWYFARRFIRRALLSSTCSNRIDSFPTGLRERTRKDSIDHFSPADRTSKYQLGGKRREKR